MNNAICKVNGEIVPCPDFITNPNPLFIGIFFGFWILMLIVAVITVVATWKIFVKAGKPGWACLIPVYNLVVMLEIVRKPIWWVFLMFIPFVNIVMAVILCLEIAKAFGKSAAFGVGLILLNPIFILILGFGRSQYIYGGQPATPISPPLNPPVNPTPAL